MDDFFGRPFSNETSSAPAGEDHLASGSSEHRPPKNAAAELPSASARDEASEPQRVADLPRAASALLEEVRRKEEEEKANRFDWSPEGEDIIIMGQRAIAVYRNPRNGIVIREESPDGDDEDAFIVLRDNDAARVLIAALKREVGERR